MTWGEVPAYADSLESLLGSGSLARLIEDLDRRADELRGYGHRMFERWLDLAMVASPAVVSE